VYGCGGIDIVVFSQADECEVWLEALDPVVERGYGDLGLMLALHGGLGFLQSVAEIEIGERSEDECGGVGGV
jgi:hypothetical protein